MEIFPGANCGSDHQLLAAKIKVKFCRIKKLVPSKRYDVSADLTSYAVELKNRFELLRTDEKLPEELWQEMETIISSAAEKHVPHKKSEKHHKWLSAQTMQTADERRLAKAKGKGDLVRQLNAAFQRSARKDKEAF